MHSVISATQTTGEQLALFASRLPHKPYCSADLAGGIYPRVQSQALRYPLIQPNPPALWGTLVFDVDREGAAYAWETGCPVPSWTAINPGNGHAHLAYSIIAPVCMSDLRRPAPVRYLHAVQQAMTDRLDADPGYAHFICKNPLSPAWRVIAEGPAYELGDFAEYLDLKGYPRKGRAADAVGLGRNVSLFDATRARAYRSVGEYRLAGDPDRWHAAVLDYAIERNAVFRTPLHLSEVAQIARSVSKWTWRNFARGHAHSVFIDRQTRKAEIAGKMTAKVRREASAQAVATAIIELHLAGRRLTVSAIARLAGVSRQTVYVLRRACPGDPAAPVKQPDDLFADLSYKSVKVP